MSHSASQITLSHLSVDKHLVRGYRIRKRERDREERETERKRESERELSGSYHLL